MSRTSKEEMIFHNSIENNAVRNMVLKTVFIDLHSQNAALDPFLFLFLAQPYAKLFIYTFNSV